MDLECLYPGRFLKGQQLSGVTKVEVMRVMLLNLDSDGDEEDGKPSARKRKPDWKGVIVVKMRDPATDEVGPKEIVWCKVNALLTAQIYGRNADEWVGKVLFIHFDPRVRFGKQTPGGIRVCGAPASVLPTEQPVTIRIKRKVGGDFVESHTLRPNGGLTPKSETTGNDGIRS